MYDFEKPSLKVTVIIKYSSLGGVAVDVNKRTCCREAWSFLVHRIQLSTTKTSLGVKRVVSFL